MSQFGALGSSFAKLAHVLLDEWAKSALEVVPSAPAVSRSAVRLIVELRLAVTALLAHCAGGAWLRSP